MRIYVLYKWDETACVSEDINRISACFLEKFKDGEDYPVFEIWRDGEAIYETNGSDVEEAISKEQRDTGVSLLSDVKNMFNEEFEK